MRRQCRADAAMSPRSRIDSALPQAEGQLGTALPCSSGALKGRHSHAHRSPLALCCMCCRPADRLVSPVGKLHLAMHPAHAQNVIHSPTTPKSSIFKTNLACCYGHHEGKFYIEYLIQAIQLISYFENLILMPNRRQEPVILPKFAD